MQGIIHFLRRDSCRRQSTMVKLSAAFLVWSSLIASIHARSWEDITPFHRLDLTPLELSLSDARMEETDPFLFTPSPSNEPPSTSEPSISPSSVPMITSRPTDRPSHSPSMRPSSSPSVGPSMSIPTPSPTLDEFAPNPAPSNPPNAYFNYNPNSPYGPGDPQMVYHNATMNKVQYFSNGWESTVYPNNGYWHEFGANGFGPWQSVLARHDVSRNQCGNVGRQSPIDVRDSGAECFEHHQIRSRVSFFSLFSSLHNLCHCAYSLDACDFYSPVTWTLAT